MSIDFRYLQTLTKINKSHFGNDGYIDSNMTVMTINGVY